MTGATTTLTATVTGSAGGAMSGQTITWTTSSASVAKVASASATTAVVTGVGAGAATITAATGGKSAAVSVTIAAPVISSAVEYGVHSDLSYNGSASYHTQGVQALTALHAKVTRGSFLWHTIEATQGTRDWSVVDDVVNKTTAANIDPLMVVYGSPAWANGTSSSTASYYLQVPQDSAAFANWVTAYASFMSAAATRYAGRVHKWELWNEENQHYFWQPVPNVTQYATWFQAVYAAIKAADPSATVSVGGLVGLCCGPTGDYSGEAFLQDLYAAGITADAVAIHPYTGDPTSTTAYQNDFTDIAVIHSLMVANGQANTPLWITEWGWATNGSTTAATVASWITTSLTMIATTYTYVTVATYFQLQDLPPTYYYGLYDSSWNLKAGGTAFATFATAQGQ